VGRSVRILFESNKLAAEEIEKGMNLAVTTAVAPDKAVAWIEGFLRGSGLVLLYHETLLNVLNHWVLSLSDEVFIKLLPILRRTFSSFEAPERRKIGEKIKGENNSTERKVEETEIDATRADKVLPLLEKILGL